MDLSMKRSNVNEHIVQDLHNNNFDSASISSKTLSKEDYDRDNEEIPKLKVLISDVLTSSLPMSSSNAMPSSLEEGIKFVKEHDDDRYPLQPFHIVNEDDLTSHSELQTPMPHFPYTSRGIETLRSLRDHWENNYRLCPHPSCDASVVTDTNLFCHWYAHHMAPGYCRVFTCKVCSRGYIDQISFRKHINLKHVVPHSQATLVAEFINGLWECKVSEDSMADTIYMPSREAIEEVYQEMFGLQDDGDKLFSYNLKDYCDTEQQPLNIVPIEQSQPQPEEGCPSDSPKGSQLLSLVPIKQQGTILSGWHKPVNDQAKTSINNETFEPLTSTASMDYTPPVDTPSIHKEILELDHIPPERQEVAGLPWKGMQSHKSKALILAWESCYQFCPHPFCMKELNSRRKFTVRKLLFAHWHQNHLLPGCGIPYICFGRDFYSGKTCDKTFDNKWDLIAHCRKDHNYEDAVIQILLYKIKVMRDTGRAQQYLPKNFTSFNPKDYLGEPSTASNTCHLSNMKDNRKVTATHDGSIKPNKSNSKRQTVAETLKAKRMFSNETQGYNVVKAMLHDNISPSTYEQDASNCVLQKGFYTNSPPEPASPQVAANMLLSNSSSPKNELPMALWKVIFKAWQRDMSCPHPSCHNRNGQKMYTHILLLRHWLHKHLGKPDCRLYPCLQNKGNADICAYVFASEEDFISHLEVRHACKSADINACVDTIKEEWDLFERRKPTNDDDGPSPKKKRSSCDGDTALHDMSGLQMTTDLSQQTISKDDKLRIEKAMGHFIQLRRLPGKKDCQACLEVLGLEEHDWKVVKNQVYNRVQQIKRTEKKRQSSENVESINNCKRISYDGDLFDL